MGEYAWVGDYRFLMRYDAVAVHYHELNSAVFQCSAVYAGGEIPYRTDMECSVDQLSTGDQFESNVTDSSTALSSVKTGAWGLGGRSWNLSVCVKLVITPASGATPLENPKHCTPIQ